MDEVVRSYTERLLALTRARLPRAIRRRVAPEDVVQSVFRSFIRVTREQGRITAQGDDLWRFLAAVAVHKVLQKVEHHTAQRRSIDREQEPADDSADFDPARRLMSGGPTPEEAATLIDELEQVMRPLIPLHRHMVEMILQGYDTSAIASSTSRTERMVRLVTKRFREQLVQRMHGALSD